MGIGIVSDYLEKKLLDYIFRGKPFPSPQNIYIGLFSTPVGDNAQGTEVDAISYSRKKITSSFNGASLGTVVNKNPIFFPTAFSEWGECSHVGIFDSLVGGNLLFYSSFINPQNIRTGDTFSFLSGEFDISLNGDISIYLANKLLDHVLNKNTFTQPTSAYLALYKTIPETDDTKGIEVSGGSYSRILCFGDLEWSAPHLIDGFINNINTKAFSIASSNWGEVTAVGIKSALNGGNLLFLKKLTESKTVFINDTFRFSPGQLVITID